MAATMAEGNDAAMVVAAAAAAAEAVDASTDVGNVKSPPTVVGGPTPPSQPSPPVRRLTKERKAKLDAIGFVWSLRNKRIDDHWDEMFRQVCRRGCCCAGGIMLSHGYVVAHLFYSVGRIQKGPW